MRGKSAPHKYHRIPIIRYTSVGKGPVPEIRRDRVRGINLRRPEVWIVVVLGRQKEGFGLWWLWWTINPGITEGEDCDREKSLRITGYHRTGV